MVVRRIFEISYEFAFYGRIHLFKLRACAVARGHSLIPHFCGQVADTAMRVSYGCSTNNVLRYLPFDT
jgi:hypothetical protein